LEAASNDRYICTPSEWQQNYWPTIRSHVSNLLVAINNLGKQNMRTTQPPLPSNASSPLVNNPAGIPISLGKHGLRQEDLHIPESKRKRSLAGTSASPASTADPASVPAISQTPITMGTPTSHPMSTPSAVGKRPSTGSPISAQLPPNKVHIGANGPIPVRERAQDDALEKRLAKEHAEELERQEARKDPLEYVKTAMYKAVGKKQSEQTGVTALPQPVMQGLADQVRSVGISDSMTSEAEAEDQPTSGQRVQLPSPPWSGTITPRQLAETFVNITDIDFARKSFYPVRYADYLNDFSMTLANGDDETGKYDTDELSDSGFLSPLVGELGWDDAYSWTKNLPIPWNGDINNFGVVA
jgi:hypothetical protein